MFSPPQSPRTFEGIPYSPTAFMNKSNTVFARLFVLACSPVTYIMKLEVSGVYI